MRAYVCTVTAVVGSALLLAASAEAGSKIKQEGMASWYNMGKRTANGERYDPMGITAAHPSLPFDTNVSVTNPSSGDSVVVRINDRGPFTGGRIIDLSHGAAQAIKLTQAGVAKVRIEVLGAAAATEAAVTEAAATAEPDPAPAVAVAQAATDAQPLRLMAEQRIGLSSR